MNWTFIVVRDNSVEQAKVFDDFWKGCEYTDKLWKLMITLSFSNRENNYKVY